jgi:D-aminopeptidase
MSRLSSKYGIRIGRLDPGGRNSITDVAGVRVGHATIVEGENLRTGVTAVIPHTGNPFYEKAKAAALTINGFGKAIGLPQINEFGTIETPILLTNTLNVGKVSDALISWMLERHQIPGKSISSINPVVAECNDSYLNDIQARAVGRTDVFSALDSASAGPAEAGPAEADPAEASPVEEGNVGAGAGVSAFEFKSGIGSASRILNIGDHQWTIGVLALPNFGVREELTINGAPIGWKLRRYEREQAKSEDGSVVLVIATDLPLSHRGLMRLAKRASFGLARTGSTCRNTSGEFVIAFTTANRLPADKETMFLDERRLNDSSPVMNDVFQAVVEAVYESVISALFEASTMVGINGHRRVSLPIDRVLAILDNENVG